MLSAAYLNLTDDGFVRYYGTGQYKHASDELDCIKPSQSMYEVNRKNLQIPQCVTVQTPTGPPRKKDHDRGTVRPDRISALMANRNKRDGKSRPSNAEGKRSNSKASKLAEDVRKKRMLTHQHILKNGNDLAYRFKTEWETKYKELLHAAIEEQIAADEVEMDIELAKIKVDHEAQMEALEKHLEAKFLTTLKEICSDEVMKAENAVRRSSQQIIDRRDEKINSLQSQLLETQLEKEKALQLVEDTKKFEREQAELRILELKNKHREELIKERIQATEHLEREKSNLLNQLNLKYENTLKDAIEYEKQKQLRLYHEDREKFKTKVDELNEQTDNLINQKKDLKLSIKKVKKERENAREAALYAYSQLERFLEQRENAGHLQMHYIVQSPRDQYIREKLQSMRIHDGTQTKTQIQKAKELMGVNVRPSVKVTEDFV